MRLRKILWRRWEAHYPQVQPLVRWLGFLLASIWRKCLWRTTFIGISGSVGKTTAKDAIAAVLAPHFPVLKTRGSSNHYIGLFRTILRVRPWHRYAVIEIGIDRPGQMEKFVALVQPDIAVWTAVAMTHMQSMRTLETVAYEKSRLIAGLRPGGIALLNVDNPYVAAYEPPAGIRVIRYGTGEGAAVRATEIRAAFPERLSFAVGEGARVRTQLIGRHWLASVLPAVVIGESVGLGREQIVAALAAMPPAPQRMTAAETAQGATFLRDERNGSIDTLNVALDVLQEARASRKVFVFSDVSDSKDRIRKRQARIARRAAGIADILVFVGESSGHAAEAAIEAGVPADRVYGCYGVAEAADTIKRIIEPGDLVLLRGRLLDHLSRVYLNLTGEVHCWRDTCPKKILCDVCPELRKAP